MTLVQINVPYLHITMILIDLILMILLLYIGISTSIASKRVRICYRIMNLILFYPLHFCPCDFKSIGHISALVWSFDKCHYMEETTASFTGREWCLISSIIESFNHFMCNRVYPKIFKESRAIPTYKKWFLNYNSSDKSNRTHWTTC